ncbi:MAG: PCMD domain-containing protein, partial [Phocaeicola sp.]
MKPRNFIICSMAMLSTVSCIQDEALNIEAAIDGCSGNNIQLSTINHETKDVTIYVNQEANMSKLRIDFTLPEGATISPDETMPNDKAPIYDFGNKRKRDFTVTSESGDTKTTYSIETVYTNLPTFYGFETLAESKDFDVFTERQEDSNGQFRFIQWASGNPGFKLSGLGKNRKDYPTVQEANGVNGGKCVKLETKSTGKWGADLMGMPIAAGNLFIGSFDENNAVIDPLKATKFGFPFKEKPISMSGWYKFKRGDVFTDEHSKVIEGKKDICDIYGVLYETDATTGFLYGDNSLTSANIALMARLPQENINETNEWTRFDIPFEQFEGGKTFSEEKMKNGKY